MPSCFSSFFAVALVASQVALALPPSASLPSASEPTIHTDSLSNTPLPTESAQSNKHLPEIRAFPDGPSVLASIYQKYGASIPNDLAISLQLRQKSGPFDFYLLSATETFRTPVFIGQSEKTFKLIFDTSSAGIWILSKDAADPKLQEGYDADDSPSSVKMELSSWRMRHGDNDIASGDVYQDILSIGTPENGITVMKQAIQVATSASGFEALSGVSGVMGMAFRSRNPIRPESQPSLFDNIAENQKLQDGVFTVDMHRKSRGTIEFGYIDGDAFTGKLGYSNVNSEAGYWNFTIGGLIGDAAPAPDGIEFAIADTTSSMVMLPMSYTSTYYKQVSDARYSFKYGGFVFPCASTMPDFPFKVGDADIVIPGEYLKFSSIEEEQDLCFGVLQPSNELGFNVIGTVAFNSAFVVFDPLNFQIGWANKQAQ
ncbi:uncharacterized protein BROUX77_003231 [Berkeleyomyces rouxiae]|uniref:uncharacterized protein n=1 Tax=Berkeleyomyces rouxiae TaxID=2035830 RepID=UPI003B82B5F7